MGFFKRFFGSVYLLFVVVCVYLHVVILFSLPSVCTANNWDAVL